jgi:hypothetical protein
MLYLVYKTTNLINGKIYIGVHSTEKEEDGYLGSGKYFLKALKKYGRENFSREILYRCSSLEEMYAEEARLVTEEFIASQTNYNQMLGGIRTGGTKGFKHRTDSKAKIGQANKVKLLGKKMSDVTRQRCLDSGVWSLDHMSKLWEGRNTPEARENFLKGMEKQRGKSKNFSEETKLLYSQKFKGKKRSPETIAKMKANHPRNRNKI